ncbi:Uncharacterised protein [Mycobacteroides abscessus subsp. abscessus]|nr:Uncharacterised protein [Mycobacteroides abscessus subsp. abscessus]SHT48423.1 Uncharacterised protein [Mycobacteroides abscessus subsp. abscessus]SKW08388.1 Uncharacterised protein [Mycobacteroides abscessus subsp. abscessus]
MGYCWVGCEEAACWAGCDDGGVKPELLKPCGGVGGADCGCC